MENSDYDFWNGVNGKVEIKSMETSYLINCIKFIERNDFVITKTIWRGGVGFCGDDMWYDEDETTTYLARPYSSMIKELLKRNNIESTWDNYKGE